MSVFKFQQFDINQKVSAAKVGTDGVLLGAWTNVSHQPLTALDIGTGTGLIALMLAQRTINTSIIGLEKDKNAFEESTYNFAQSPWHNRVEAIHQDYLTYTTANRFDLIVSNPPFYKDQTYAPIKERSQARQEFYLPFEILIKKSAALLTPKGILSLIIPYKEKDHILQLAKENHLYPNRICNVKGNIKAPFKRSMIELTNFRGNVEYSSLIIEKERHQYTQDYIHLTRDFYLKM